jgi:hypothetical protein
MNYLPIDVSSVQGLILSISFILLANVLAILTMLIFLQGLSYFLAIILAVDTLTGNNIKNRITNYIKKKRNATNKSKSKGDQPD